MNRDKLRNMRKSITSNGEILIDTKCYWAVSWNYKGRNENCRPILKGYGLLEPYAVKVASTVLRRGRAGNRSFLFDYELVVINGLFPYQDAKIAKHSSNILCVLCALV